MITVLVVVTLMMDLSAKAEIKRVWNGTEHLEECALLADAIARIAVEKNMTAGAVCFVMEVP